jgi:hypothetical protein
MKCIGLWLPVKCISTDQLVRLWVCSFKVLSTRKDENYLWGELPDEVGELQFLTRPWGESIAVLSSFL